MAGGIAFAARTGVSGGSERLARAMINKVKPRIVAAADATGEAATDKIIEIIHATYGERKGKARSEPLATPGNYTHKINESPRGVTLIFNVEGTPNFMKKFGALNYGSPAHTITGGRLGNRADTSERAKGFFAKGTVTHPGTTGTRFWQRGCEAALDGFTGRLQ